MMGDLPATDGLILPREFASLRGDTLSLSMTSTPDIV